MAKHGKAWQSMAKAWQKHGKSMAKHNWTMNGTTVDKNVKRATVAAICGCNHMTPATVDEMDAKLGIGSSKSNVEPDPEVIDASNENQGDWSDEEPGPEAFENDR